MDDQELHSLETIPSGWLMSSISIEKVNDVYIRVISDRSIEQELADRFTFMVEGYKFTPAYKSGVWDGKIRLYNLAKKTIYAGLLHHILKYAEENDLTVNYLNEVATTEDIDIDYVKKFTDWLNIHSRGKSIKLRDYQIDGIHRALTQKRLLLLSPTSCLDPHEEIEVDLDNDMINYLDTIRKFYR